MLAGEHAADIDAQAQDVRAEGLGALDVALAVGVVRGSAVQIAVAGMEHVDHRQTVPLRQIADLPSTCDRQ